MDESTVDEEDDDDDEPHSPPPYDAAGVHLLGDGHYWHEIPGIPFEDTHGPDISLFNGDVALTKRPIRVRFTSNPIKGAPFPRTRVVIGFTS